jgi:hypothetical protein
VAILRTPEVTSAAVTALAADATLTTLLGSAKVYTHVPEQTTAPYVAVIGGHETVWAEVYDSTGDDGARQVDVEATIVSSYFGTKEMDDISSRVVAVLTTQSSWASVTKFQVAEFVESLRPDVLDVNGVLFRVRTVICRVFTA